MSMLWESDKHFDQWMQSQGVRPSKPLPYAYDDDDDDCNNIHRVCIASFNHMEMENRQLRCHNAELLGLSKFLFGGLALAVTVIIYLLAKD